MSTSGTGAIVPNPPIMNQGNPYINGMRLVWLTTTTFSVTAGQCRDQSNTTDILMGASFLSGSGAGTTNSLSGSAAVTVNVGVSGAGGIDLSTVTASKQYSVYAIGDSRGFNAGSAIMSLNAPSVSPHLPLGYDCWRYIGSVSIDSSSHVRPFMQYGAQALRTVVYDPGTGATTKGVTIPSSGTAGSTTFVNVGVLTTLVPQSALECIYNVALTPNSANNVLLMAPATVDNGTTACVGAVASMSGAATGSAQVGTVRVPCSLPNATQQSGLTIANVVTSLYATTSSSDTVVFLLNGYVDQL